MNTINWILVGIGLVGTITNIFKIKWCFVVWGISNIGFIAVNYYNEIYSMAFFFFINFLSCAWGLYKWHKDEENRKFQEVINSIYIDWLKL
jgi:uncharacterized membrane protein